MAWRRGTAPGLIHGIEKNVKFRIKTRIVGIMVGYMRLPLDKVDAIAAKFGV